MKRKGVCQAIVFAELLLVYCAAQTQHVRQKASCNDDVTIKCPGVDCIEFLSVTWYKSVNGQRFGIIKKRKRVEEAQMYDYARNVSIVENYSLFLPRVEPSDSGTYVCGIGANVGGQSLYPTVELTVHECVTQVDPTSQVVGLSPTKAMNTPQSIQMQELPIMWTIVGYVAVVLVKVVLSLISIWVLRSCFSKKQQQKRQRRRSS